MKAVVIKKPGEAYIDSVPEPKVENGKILLRVRLVGLCGSDLNSYRGKNPMVQFPRIPGHEVAATVVGTEGSARGLPEGTNVTVLPYTNCGNCASCLRGRPNACQFNETLGVQRDGALTEFIALPPENLYPAPLELKELCLVEPLTVGFHAVARGRVTPKDKVAVFGCGGVGLGAIAASAFAGATTIAIDLDDRKLALARKVGAKYSINTKIAGLREELLGITGGHGPDVVIEAIGLPQTFRSAVEVVAFTGRVVYIGYAKETVEYETKLFVQKELDIMGARNASPNDFHTVIQMLVEKKFPVEESIGLVVPLEKGPETFAKWSANPESYTKIMVQVT